MTRKWSATYQLSPAAKSFWLSCNLLVGLVPSFAFFAWVERNMAFPIPSVAIQLGWPWIDLGANSSTLEAVLWDAGLFLAFGAIHSGMAQERVQHWLRRFFPPQAIRTVYLMLTGMTVTFLMGFWQHTGVLLWVAPFSRQANSGWSLILYWGFLSLCVLAVRGFDGMHFFGFRQLGLKVRELDQTSGSPRLCDTGIYGVVRHPIYLFTLLAAFVTPMMSLDRFVLSLSIVAYLTVAIPIEERKLIALFGPSYQKYRKRVPAILPGLNRIRRLIFKPS